MKNYGKFVTGLVIVWFLLALSASALHLFQNASNRVGVAVAIAAATPLVIFALWFAASEGFRQFTLSLDPRILTSAQAWRFIGFTFILLEDRSLLPAIFAWPAGYGDMAIGITAGFVAWKLVTPARRNAFILWQALGITDLVTAVTLGTTAQFLRPQDPSMLPMTVLPLSLVPTFLVPLYLILHAICIAQTRSWKFASASPRPTISAAQQPAI
jgi:hypothetical protein